METTTSPGYENLVAENVRLKAELAEARKLMLEVKQHHAEGIELMKGAHAEIEKLTADLAAAREALEFVRINLAPIVNVVGHALNLAAKEENPPHFVTGALEPMEKTP